MSGRAGLEAYLTLKATLSVLVAKVEGRLTGSIALEASGDALLTVGARWSRSDGLEIEEGKLAIEADAQFVAKLVGGIRVYLDLWLAEIDIWEEELKIADVEFGPAIKVGLALPVAMKDGELETGKLDQNAFQYPDISSEQGQQKLVKDAASQDEKVKEPPPPSKEEAINALRRLDAGPISTWDVIFMDADEARERVASSDISRDSYITWLRFKHKQIDWSEAIAIGSRRDRAEFEQFKAEFLAAELTKYDKFFRLQSFSEDHERFTESHMDELRALLG